MLRIFETRAQKVMKSHLVNMVRMAKSDGEFHKNERQLIRKIGLENGLNEEQISDVMYHTNEYVTDLPVSKKLRFFQLVDFVKLMLEDGHISEQERNLFIGLVHQLGFRRSFAGIISEKIERGLEEGKNKRQLYFLCFNLLD